MVGIAAGFAITARRREIGRALKQRRGVVHFAGFSVLADDREVLVRRLTDDRRRIIQRGVERGIEISPDRVAVGWPKSWPANADELVSAVRQLVTCATVLAH